jgi:hypothetical protein
LNCTFSSLFHNRAALLALGIAIPNCKRGAKEQAGGMALENVDNCMILNGVIGRAVEWREKHGFWGAWNRVKPARNPAKSTS